MSLKWTICSLCAVTAFVVVAACMELGEEGREEI